MEICSTCKFWDSSRTKKGEDAPCRRYPPRTEIQRYLTKQVIVVIWPLPAATDFCGEWKPRLEKRPEYKVSDPMTDKW